MSDIKLIFNNDNKEASNTVEAIVQGLINSDAKNKNKIKKQETPNEKLSVVLPCAVFQKNAKNSNTSFPVFKVKDITADEHSLLSKRILPSDSSNLEGFGKEAKIKADSEQERNNFTLDAQNKASSAAELLISSLYKSIIEEKDSNSDNQNESISRYINI